MASVGEPDQETKNRMRLVQEMQGQEIFEVNGPHWDRGLQVNMVTQPLDTSRGRK
jgi:hypothetical protein